MHVSVYEHISYSIEVISREIFLEEKQCVSFHLPGYLYKNMFRMN